MLAIQSAADDMQEWGYGWCETCRAWRKIRLVYLDTNQNRRYLDVGRGQEPFAQLVCAYRGHEIAHLAHTKPTNK